MSKTKKTSVIDGDWRTKGVYMRFLVENGI